MPPKDLFGKKDDKKKENQKVSNATRTNSVTSTKWPFVSDIPFRVFKGGCEAHPYKIATGGHRPKDGCIECLIIKCQQDTR